MLFRHTRHDKYTYIFMRKASPRIPPHVKPVPEEMETSDCGQEIIWNRGDTKHHRNYTYMKIPAEAPKPLKSLATQAVNFKRSRYGVRTWKSYHAKHIPSPTYIGLRHINYITSNQVSKLPTVVTGCSIESWKDISDRDGYSSVNNMNLLLLFGKHHHYWWHGAWIELYQIIFYRVLALIQSSPPWSAVTFVGRRTGASLLKDEGITWTAPYHAQSYEPYRGEEVSLVTIRVPKRVEHCICASIISNLVSFS